MTAPVLEQQVRVTVPPGDTVKEGSWVAMAWKLDPESKKQKGVRMNNKDREISPKVEIQNPFKPGQQVRRNWTNKKDDSNMCHGVDFGRNPCPQILALPSDDLLFPTEDTIWKGCIFVLKYANIILYHLFVPLDFPLRATTLSKVDLGLLCLLGGNTCSSTVHGPVSNWLKLPYILQEDPQLHLEFFFL